MCDTTQRITIHGNAYPFLYLKNYTLQTNKILVTCSIFFRCFSRILKLTTTSQHLVYLKRFSH